MRGKLIGSERRKLPKGGGKSPITALSKKGNLCKEEISVLYEGQNWLMKIEGNLLLREKEAKPARIDDEATRVKRCMPERGGVSSQPEGKIREKWVIGVVREC